MLLTHCVSFLVNGQGGLATGGLIEDVLGIAAVPLRKRKYSVSLVLDWALLKCCRKDETRYFFIVDVIDVPTAVERSFYFLPGWGYFFVRLRKEVVSGEAIGDVLVLSYGERGSIFIYFADSRAFLTEQKNVA